MFKKTLIAAALMSAGLSTAFAGEITISGDAYKVGNEYLAAYTGTALEGDLQTAKIGITYKAGIALGVDNTVKFTFDGGAIAADTGLKLMKIAARADAAAAQDTAAQALVTTATAAVTTTGTDAVVTAAVKAAAINALKAAVVADPTINVDLNIIDVNAVADVNLAAAITAVDAAATLKPVALEFVPADTDSSVAPVADMVDFKADDNGNYEWVLFKVTHATAVSDRIIFNDVDGDGSANIVTKFTKATIGSGDLTVEVDEAFDSTAQPLTSPIAKAKKLVTTADQFKVVLTAAEDDIDVEQDRKFFAQSPAFDGVKISKEFKYDVTTTPVSLGIDADAATFTAKLTGNLAGVTKVAYDSATSANDKDFVEGATTGTAIEDATITVTVDGKTVLDTRTIGINMLINPTEATTNDFYLVGNATSFSDAFVWDLNGSQVDIPYMPYSTITPISQIIYVVNEGEQIGDISIDAWTEDGTKVLENVLLGQTVKYGTTKVTAEIKEALAAEGVTDGKVRMRLVSNVPVADVEVYSAYNVNSSDRGLVINSSNKTSTSALEAAIANAIAELRH